MVSESALRLALRDRAYFVPGSVCVVHEETRMVQNLRETGSPAATKDGPRQQPRVVGHLSTVPLWCHWLVSGGRGTVSFSFPLSEAHYAGAWRLPISAPSDASALIGLPQPGIRRLDVRLETIGMRVKMRSDETMARRRIWAQHAVPLH